MSFQSLADVFAYVQSCDEIPTSEVVTLLALAWHKNSKTGACFPSIATLQRTTKLSRRGQQKALRRLEAKGVVKTTHAAVYRSCDYQLCLPEPLRPEAPCAPGTPPPVPCTPVQGSLREEKKDPAAPRSENTPSVGQVLLDIAARIQTAWRLGITPDSAIWRAMVGLADGDDAVRWAT